MKMIRILLTSLTLAVSSFVYAGPIDINTADVKSLIKNVKGVGFKKAQAIVAYREKHGLFNQIEELIKVKGIGRKLLDKNRDIIFIESQKINIKNKNVTK